MVFVLKMYIIGCGVAQFGAGSGDGGPVGWARWAMVGSLKDEMRKCLQKEAVEHI